LGASVAAGFALSRFARSSERHPGYADGRSGYGDPGYSAARRTPYGGPGGTGPYDYPSDPAPARGGSIDDTFAKGRARTGESS
jgi:hypothetical protein